MGLAHLLLLLFLSSPAFACSNASGLVTAGVDMFIAFGGTGRERVGFGEGRGKGDRWWWG